MSFAKVMDSMLDSMRIDESLHKLVPSLERLLVHWCDPLRLIIMGEFNAGKSTLINTLLRDEIIASGIVPTTAIATYIRFAKEKYIEVVYEDGKVERKTIQEMEKLSSERNAEGKEQRKNIQYINLYLPNPILKNIVLIDTPGLGGLHSQHDLQAFDAFGEADDSIWIFKFGSVGKNSEVSVINQLKNDGLHPIGLVNMIDQSNDDDIQPYIDYEFEKLDGRVRKLLGVSAIEAKEAYERNDLELLEISGFPQLINLIEEIKQDKDSRKKTRFNQSFLKFWNQLNDAVNQMLNSEKYIISIQKISSDLLDVKQENEIILMRLAEEESQMLDNNQQILFGLSKTVYLNDWALRYDFNKLIDAIPELKEWKEFNDEYVELLKQSMNLKFDIREFKTKVVKEFGEEKIRYSTLLSTNKHVLGKYRFQQANLLSRQKELNKQIKKINAIHGHLLKEKNLIQEKLVDYYERLLEKNKTSVIDKIENEKVELTEVNLLSKKLLQDQILQWDYLVDLQQHMLQVKQYVENASMNGKIQGELPHLKEEQLVENEIAFLNEELRNSSEKKNEKLHLKLSFKLPGELNSIDEVPRHFLRNIRPLVGASALALVASAFIFFKEPISNMATAANEMFSDVMLTNAKESNINKETFESNDNYDYKEYDYYESGHKTSAQSYELLENAPEFGRYAVGTIDVGGEEIPIYQGFVTGYEAVNYVLPPYSSWDVYSEIESYYEIQENYWVKKEDAAHLFTEYLQEYVQAETVGIASIYPITSTSDEVNFVYEEANSESSIVGYLGNKYYEVFSFTENGWMQIGENAWVFYDDQYITLEQIALSENLNMYFSPSLRTEETTNSFIPLFAENTRDSAVIGYLENVAFVDIYELPTSKWANIGTNAWIEADKYLNIDWDFIPEVYGETIGTLTVDVSALNVREMDFEESNLIGILPRGTTVDVYEVSPSTGWYRIGATGWVSEDPEYSKFNRIYQTYPTSELAIGTAEVLVDINVRLNNHMKAESQGILRKGTVVDVYEISPETGWYRIGYDAWISNSGNVVIYKEYEVEGY